MTDADQERLLLLAAFAEPGSALPAWQDWVRHSDWQNQVSAHAYLLLPAIHRNLADADTVDELFPRLAGVKKRNLAANGPRIIALLKLLTLLSQARCTPVATGWTAAGGSRWPPSRSRC